MKLFSLFSQLSSSVSISLSLSLSMAHSFFFLILFSPKSSLCSYCLAAHSNTIPIPLLKHIAASRNPLYPWSTETYHLKGWGAQPLRFTRNGNDVWKEIAQKTHFRKHPTHFEPSLIWREMSMRNFLFKNVAIFHMEKNESVRVDELAKWHSFRRADHKEESPLEKENWCRKPIVIKEFGTIWLTCWTLVCLFTADSPLKYGSLTNSSLERSLSPGQVQVSQRHQNFPPVPGLPDGAKHPSSLFSHQQPEVTAWARVPALTPPGRGWETTSLWHCDWPWHQLLSGKRKRKANGGSWATRWAIPVELGSCMPGRALNSSNTKTQKNPPVLWNSHTFVSY